MDRSIKYRFWDKFNRNMHYQKGTLPSDLKRFFDNYNAHFEGGNGVELMEYIGLRDKAGQDVYEKDIVFEGGNFGIIEWDKEYSKYVMRTNQANLGLYLFSGEIVGNIYENPELLEDG